MGDQVGHTTSSSHLPTDARVAPRTAALLLVQVLAAPALAAATVYVSPAGNDGNTCLAPSAPCATINAAVGKASTGDTVVVAVGTYKDTSSEVVLIQKALTLSGGWDSSFASRPGYSTIDGQSARRGVQASAPGASVTLQRLIIENGTGMGT